MNASIDINRKDLKGEKMKRNVYWMFALLVLVSLLLSACGGGEMATQAPAEPETVVEDPAPEVVEEPEAVVEPEPEVEPEPAAPDLDGAFGDLLANMTSYNTTNADALLEAMVDAPPFLVDVRTVEEVQENGYIEGAINIPLNELAQNLNLLPDFDTPIVTYCGSGWRATIAMTALDALGWNDVKALKVTFADWVAAGNPVVEGVPEAEVLDAASPDAGMVAAIDAMLQVYGVKPYGGIDAEGLNTALVEKSDMVVIDVRRVEEVDEKGDIDTGDVELIHIPLEEFVAKKDMWPADLGTDIAVYCGSGHRSTMALTILGTYGYSSVLSLKGGFGGWVEAGYPVVGGMAPEQPSAQEMMGLNFEAMLASMEGYNTVKADALMVELAEDQPPFLLDVRTTEEVEEKGHIEGATHIPLAELAQHIDLLPAFDTPIVTYCGSGWRATIAMTILHGMGYTDVRALKTPFADWVAAGNPVIEGLPEPMVLNTVEIDAGLLAAFDTALQLYGVAPYAAISADNFNLALAENPDLIMIDVRKLEELEADGVIDTGDLSFIHIPLESFIAQMDLWPADKDANIVIYCGSGHRSTMATAMLGAYGYTNVSSLQGGFGGWVEAGYPVAEFAAP
jgi:rhodanese-related sulfurtransferase